MERKSGSFLTLALFPYGYRAVLMEPSEEHPRGVPIGVSGIFETLEDASGEATEWGKRDGIPVKPEAFYEAPQVPWTASWLAYVMEGGPKRRDFLKKCKPKVLTLFRRIFRAGYYRGVEEGYRLALRQNGPNLNVKN